jgi:hypothetical protein
MKKPTHVNILGVEIPLATLSLATWNVPIYATIGEYNNYYSESSPDIAEAIHEFETSQSVFKKMVNGDLLPSNKGGNYQFFNYKTLSDLAYEGSI